MACPQSGGGGKLAAEAVIDHGYGDENDDRNSNLDYDNKVSDPEFVSTGGHRGIHRLESHNQIRFRTLQRGRKTEEKHAQESCSQAEQEHAMVGSNVDHERQVGRDLDPVEEMGKGPAKPHARKSARNA